MSRQVGQTVLAFGHGYGLIDSWVESERLLLFFTTSWRIGTHAAQNPSIPSLQQSPPLALVFISTYPQWLSILKSTIKCVSHPGKSLKPSLSHAFPPQHPQTILVAGTGEHWPSSQATSPLWVYDGLHCLPFLMTYIYPCVKGNSKQQPLNETEQRGKISLYFLVLDYFV